MSDHEISKIVDSFYFALVSGVEVLGKLSDNLEENAKSTVDCGHSIRDGLEAVAKSIDRLGNVIKGSER